MRIKERKKQRKIIIKITITFICILLGFNSRQDFYKAVKRDKKKRKEAAKVVELVKDLRVDLSMPRIGTRKLYPDLVPSLQKEGIKMGRDKVHQVLKDFDQLINPLKKYRATTDSKHRFWKYGNCIKKLIDKGLINRPEQVFVGDITYIKVNGKYAYLFLLTDLYSKKIMGWSINYTMKVKDAKKAILMAHKNRIYSGPVYHHTDRGIQYCTPSYIKYIKKKNMIPSMTEKDHVYENAMAERMNGILKSEFGLRYGFESLKDARAVIDHAINIYNSKRRHYSLDLETPDFIHLNNPDLKFKTWGNKKSDHKLT